jgi:hypothetical protein
MSLLVLSLFSVVAQAAVPPAWSKNPRDWERPCSTKMHWCEEARFPSKYSDRRPRCPRGAYQWVKVTDVQPALETNASPARCVGEYMEDTTFYPVSWSLSFGCDPSQFDHRADGDYAKVYVGYRLRHYPRPSKYSKLTERYQCEPAVGAGSLDELFY